MGGKISAHSAVQEAYLVLHEVGQRGGQKFELLVKLHPCRHSEHSVRRIIVEQQLLHDHRDFSSTSAPSVSTTGGEVSGSSGSCPGAGCGWTGGLALFSSSLPHPFPHPPGRGGMLSGARSREGSYGVPGGAPAKHSVHSMPTVARDLPPVSNSNTCTGLDANWSKETRAEPR